MSETLPTILSALIGGLLGGGGVARLFVAALENRMRTTFATHDAVRHVEETVSTLDSRLTGVLSVAHAANDVAGSAHSMCLENERRADERWGTLDARLKESASGLEKTADRFETSLEKTADRFERIMERLIRLEERVNHHGT
jgi:hypothetical protein